MDYLTMLDCLLYCLVSFGVITFCLGKNTTGCHPFLRPFIFCLEKRIKKAVQREDYAFLWKLLKKVKRVHKKWGQDTPTFLDKRRFVSTTLLHVAIDFTCGEQRNVKNEKYLRYVKFIYDYFLKDYLLNLKHTVPLYELNLSTLWVLIYMCSLDDSLYEMDDARNLIVHLVRAYGEYNGSARYGCQARYMSINSRPKNVTGNYYMLIDFYKEANLQFYETYLATHEDKKEERSDT